MKGKSGSLCWQQVHFIEFMLTQIDNTLAELLNQMTNSATDDAILDADGANHGADNMADRFS